MMKTKIKAERCSRSILTPLIIAAVSLFTFILVLLKSLRASPSLSIARSNSNHFNLMEDGPKHLEPFECTQDSINALQLEQDHPCVTEVIRKHFLHPPSSPQIPYNFVHKNNPVESQTIFILNQLMYPTEGFFVECGAFDGETISNTLYMERILDWNGILIEANPDNYEKLRKKNRKAWSLPVCLSLEPYPTTVQFGKKGALGKILTKSSVNFKGHDEIVTVQCFPLYSILLAVNQTSLDYFSLDVEGHELFVLKTIPWHKVDIKTLSVEFENIITGGGEKGLIHYLKSQGYLLINRFTYGDSRDVIFMSAKHAPEYL